MKLILIRHAEPDYSDVLDRNFIGQGLDFGHLSETGIRQAEAVSTNPRLSGAQVIFSSPYTRTLQTSAILSKNTCLPIKVLTDLCEWIPDLTFRAGVAERGEALQEMKKYHGIHTEECKYQWESLSTLGKRVFDCLLPYNDLFDKVIVVAHSLVIRQFRNEPIPHCGIVESEFNEDSKWIGYKYNSQVGYHQD